MMANVKTGIRILVSAALLLCPVFSPIFYAMYLIAGLSDMADGIVARKKIQSVNLDRDSIQSLILYLWLFRKDIS